MPQITIDSNSFLRGEGLSDFSGNRGFSPKSKNIIINATDGALGSKGTPLATGTVPDGLSPIAVAERVSAGTGPYVLLADATEDLHVYTTNGSTLTTDSKEDTGRNYVAYITNAIRYKDKIYVSSTTNIAYDIAAATPDWDWGTTVASLTFTDNAFCPHMFLVVSGVLLISDANVVKSWDGTTANNAMLTFSDTDQKISAWSLHNDNVYLATTNATSSQKGRNYLHIWDGRNKNNTLISKDIPLPSRCLKMESWDGRLILFFRDFFGEFDGVRVNKISNLDWKTDGAFNYMVAQSGDGLYFVDKYTRTSPTVSCIKHLTSNGALYTWYELTALKVLFSYFISSGYEEITFISSTIIRYHDRDTYADNGVFYSNWFNFPDNTKITRLLIEFAEPIVSGDANAIRLYNEKLSILGSDPTNYIELTANYSSAGGMINYAREFRDINFYCSALQVVLNTFDTAVKRITITYEDGRNQPIPTY